MNLELHPSDVELHHPSHCGSFDDHISRVGRCGRARANVTAAAISSIAVQGGNDRTDDPVRTFDPCPGFRRAGVAPAGTGRACRGHGRQDRPAEIRHADPAEAEAFSGGGPAAFRSRVAGRSGRDGADGGGHAAAPAGKGASRAGHHGVQARPAEPGPCVPGAGPAVPDSTVPSAGAYLAAFRSAVHRGTGGAAAASGASGHPPRACARSGDVGRDWISDDRDVRGNGKPPHHASSTAPGRSPTIGRSNPRC